MTVNSFKNKSKKVVLSRFFLFTPILVILIAFQAKEPAFSNAQIQDLDYNFVETLQTDTDHVFVSVEVLPVPPGGVEAFIRSIADSYVFPKEAKAANVKGKLEVSFIVGFDGRFSNIELTKDLGYGTGEEIIRVLENSRRWPPGIGSVRPVRAQYTLQISIGEKIEVISVHQARADQSSQNVTNGLSSSALFLKVEQPPVPIDGMSAFLKYVGDNYIYPKAAVESKVSGSIVLSFIVEEDGSLSYIWPIRDLGFGTGAEAVRLLKAGPKWKPGVQNGKVVRVQYTLPIVLDLSNDSQ